jgi:hypothetical protein
MADKKLNEVPVVSDIVTIFGKRSNGEIVQIDKSNLATLLGGLMNSLKLFPFMSKGILSTDEEVNSATTSGMYHVFGRDGISVVSNYSIMIVFNDGQGYVIQMTFRLGEDVVGFRRNYDGKWGDFRSFVLAS